MRRALVPLVLGLLLLAAPARTLAHAQDHPAGSPRPTVALVLSGGAARGAAHVGVIQELVAAGVPIDVVTGSSIGAIVGGLYAAGFAADELATLLRFVDPTSAARLQFPLRGGVLDSEPLRRILAALLEDRRVLDTHIPFRALVTDLETGEPHAPTDVPLALAMQASAAVPILFNPVRIGDRHYVDGGFRQLVPAEAALALGADYLIAVDVTQDRPLDPEALQSVAASMLGGLMRPYTEASLRLVSVVVRPAVHAETYLDFARTEAYIAAGRAAARERLPTILADLRARGIALRDDGDPHRDHPINDGWRERLAHGDARWDARALRLDAGLDTSTAFTRDPDALSDRFAIGLALGGGDLGRGSIGVVLERGSENATNALTLRLGYHVLDTVEIVATTTARLERDTSLRIGVRWRPLPEVRLAVAHDLLTDLTDTQAALRTDPLWLDASAQARLGDWWRAGIDARAAVGAPDTGPGNPELGVRAFAVVANPDTPTEHAIRIDPAWFRAAGPTAVTHALTGGSIELRTDLHEPLWLSDAVQLTTRARVFLELVHHDARSRTGTGAGITLEGAVAGFLPFALHLDLAVDLSDPNLRLSFRTGPEGPRPWREVAVP